MAIPTALPAKPMPTKIIETINRLPSLYRRYAPGDPIPQELSKLQAELETSLQQISLINGDKNLLVEASVGKGRLTQVPWLAVMDARETDTAQRGVYVVFLFRNDMSGFYLCLACGISEFAGQSNGNLMIGEKARALRGYCSKLSGHGFSMSNDIDLRAEGKLARAYKLGTAAFKFYEFNNMPTSQALIEDLAAAIVEYRKYVDAQVAQVSTEHDSVDDNASAWIFQANPKFYDIDEALQSLVEIDWVVTRYAKEIHAGNEVYLWRAGKDSALIARAIVASDPTERSPKEAELPFYRKSKEASVVAPRVALRIDQVFAKPVTRAEFLNNSILKDSLIIRQPNATNYALTPRQHQAIESLLRQEEISVV